MIDNTKRNVIIIDIYTDFLSIEQRKAEQKIKTEHLYLIFMQSLRLCFCICSHENLCTLDTMQNRDEAIN